MPGPEASSGAVSRWYPALQHVAMADEGYCIGPAAARDSYLRGDRILEVGRWGGPATGRRGAGS